MEQILFSLQDSGFVLLLLCGHIIDDMRLGLKRSDKPNVLPQSVDANLKMKVNHITLEFSEKDKDISVLNEGSCLNAIFY